MHENSGTPREWATLLRASATGRGPLRIALQTAGSPAALLAAGRSQWKHWGLPPATCDYLALDTPAEVEADLAWLERDGAMLLPCTDPRYPSLLDAAGAPLALYVQGDPDVLVQRQLALVGSRSPTAAGRRIALQLARELAQAGFVITSGLARGIDTAAHEGALDAGGRTIAVLGTGPDLCYPPGNEALARRIANAGALISEFPPGTAPRAQNFPRRNRIIAALSGGTVVVEAAASSGSLITARLALDLGRDVFAVPGSPLNLLAAGCLALLRDGAILTRDAQDVLAEFKVVHPDNHVFNQGFAATDPSVSGLPRLDKEYQMLLDALGFEPASIDDLVERTGIAPGSVASMMLILELQGRVELRPGALFNRVD